MMTKDLFPSDHPLTPPHLEEDWVSWLRLLRSRRVGPATFMRLMREHGSAAAALRALPDVARAAGVQKYQIFPENLALSEMQAGKLAGAQLVAIGQPDYPKELAQINDAPPLLWMMGNMGILRRPMVALVGARNASSIGTRMAQNLAKGLGEAGFVVVSGLARGVDTAAHIAATPFGTLAVMAGGVDVVYPAENAVLAQEILDNGLRVSEQPMGMRPIARHFPQRNRIISGLCRGVIVVEAAARSGSLITARSALDQGRDVLAVPGHPFDARASGNNFLIRDGAVLVRSVEDVISALSPPQAPAPRNCTIEIPAPATENLRADITKLHGEILSRLSTCPLAEDQLIRDLGLGAADLAPLLLSLELDGKVQRQPGGMLSRTAPIQAH